METSNNVTNAAEMEALRYPIGRYQQPETYTQQQLEEWIKQIKVLPSWLDACIENLDADQMHTPYRPEGWTVAQVIHHISDSHINAFVRLKLALTEESPNVKPYQEDLWAKLPDTHVVPVNVSITLLHALHQKMVAILNNIQPHDWERTFYHPQHGRYIQVWQLAALYAWHGRHHVAHITGLRDRMGW